ncbi:matrixin family metalloprotease [Haloferula sargassicola]|uniref:Peptidase M10 metallopeptidase domain-containing protein n=1 Tax=Haloferula sargassicola TaxID=490096 RepID=A0ABP9UJJ1_9BACT
MKVGLLLLAACPAMALEIEIDYRYDTSDFFSQPGAKTALRAVADSFEALLQDQLTAIVPTGVNTWTPGFFHPATGEYVHPPELQDMVVPQDTLIIFVGGRSLAGGSVGVGGPGGYTATATSGWLNGLRFRGQAGAAATPATDIGPWGGSIAFDTGETWNFDLAGRPANDRSDFVSVALHEMCHVLGFGTSDVFDGRISTFGGGLVFTGSSTMQIWGTAVPLDPEAGHWRDDDDCQAPLGYNPSNPDNVLSVTLEGFGRQHGQAQIALMDPTHCTLTTVRHLEVLTDLDLAALRDLGWEILPPPRLEIARGNDPPTLSWPTSSGVLYSIHRSPDLSHWTAIRPAAEGDGMIDHFTDSMPASGGAFYQLKAVLPPPAAALAMPAMTSDPSSTTLQASLRARVVDSCRHCGQSH